MRGEDAFLMTLRSNIARRLVTKSCEVEIIYAAAIVHARQI